MPPPVMAEANRRSPRRACNLLGRVVSVVVLAAAFAVAGLATPRQAEAAPHRRAVEAPIVRPEEGQVRRLYLAVLGRDADADGFAYWVSRRIEGVDLTTVAAGFVSSAEFGARFGAPTDAGFLERVYDNVLGRTPDPEGLAYWSAQLRAGLGRPALVLAFSESPELAVRTGTTLPALPPFSARIDPVGVDELGASWRPGCPVGPDELRSITADHVDATGRRRIGTIVVHRRVAADVVGVLGVLYDRRYPIASLRPVAEFDGNDDASMAADNTSGFNCRPVTGGTGWSRHAYGLAIDLNPIRNPYVRGARVLPPEGLGWVDRRLYHPAMIRPGDAVTAAFAAVGWRWGGDFASLADYQHFER